MKRMKSNFLSAVSRAEVWAGRRPGAATSPPDVTVNAGRQSPAVTRLRRPPQAWDRLKKNKVALAGVGVVVVVALVAILAPWLAPYDPAGPFAAGVGPAGGAAPPPAPP